MDVKELFTYSCFFAFSESVLVKEGDETLNKTRFEPTRRMSTYLLAFIVSDFKSIGQMEGDVLVTMCFCTLTNVVCFLSYYCIDLNQQEVCSSFLLHRSVFLPERRPSRQDKENTHSASPAGSWNSLRNTTMPRTHFPNQVRDYITRHLHIFTFRPILCLQWVPMWWVTEKTSCSFIVCNESGLK